MKAKNARKPREVWSGEWVCTLGVNPLASCVRINTLLISPKDCERLAAWLLKAAKWTRQEAANE